MTPAATSQVQLRYTKEDTFGVVPVSEATELPYTGESLQYTLQKSPVTAMRGNRMLSNVITTDYTTDGSVSGEMQYAAYDDLLAGVLQSEWDSFGANGVGQDTLVTFAVDSITASSPTSGYSAFTRLRTGQWFSVSSGVNAGKLFRVSPLVAPTSTVITLDVITPATVAGPTTTTLMVSRLADGEGLQSFSIERASLDTSEYFAYRGMTPNSFSLSVTSNALSTVEFGFVGQDAVVDSLPIFESVVLPRRYAVMSGVTGSSSAIYVAGLALTDTNLTSITLSYKSNITANRTIGNQVVRTVGDGEVTANLEIYFASGKLFYDNFLNNAGVELAFTAFDMAGNGYVFTMPKAVVKDYKVNAGSKDADLMVSVSFAGLLDIENANPNLRKALIVDRVGAPFTDEERDLLALFDNGINGVRFQFDKDSQWTLFQNADFTNPVTAVEQTVGSFLDLSGRGNHATQATAGARAKYQEGPARLVFDKVDDLLTVTVPVGGWVGTMVIGTTIGTAAYGVNIPAGAYTIGPKTGKYFPGNNIVGQIVRNGALSGGEITSITNYMVSKGAKADYGGVTSFYAFWWNWNELTSFPLIDTSSGTNFSYAWYGCTSLTSFPLIDTSSGTNFYIAWRGCTSLTSFPLIDTSSGINFSSAWSFCAGLTSFPLIDTSVGTNFSYAWYGCNSLTSFPLIDTSVGTNFSSAWSFCTSLTSFPLIDTSSGINFSSAWSFCTSLTSFPANAFDAVKGGNFTNAFASTSLTQASIDGILVSLVTSGIATGTRVFNQSGGSAPSVGIGQPAITTLRSRGWTVTVTGGF